MSFQAAPEDELRLALGLQNYTSGKGKVELKDSSMRPIEIFMCSVVSIAVARIVDCILCDSGDAQIIMPGAFETASVLCLHGYVS